MSLESTHASPPPLPRMLGVRQIFPPPPPIDPQTTIRQSLGRVLRDVAPGARIAVAVGSRGISKLPAIVEATVGAVREAGADPFIVPAMGSHGGATAEGQQRLLAGYGVSEANLKVPVRASMAVKTLGTTASGLEVVSAEEALGADAVVLINRIKPHTDFGGDLGSGLLKMLVVGLGKHAGAANFHRGACRYGYLRMLREAAALALKAFPRLYGVAIIEDQQHRLAAIETLRGTDFESRELELCAQAKALMPRLPLTEIDLLVVDRIGKDISGVGMDPMVIGRMIHGYSLNEELERREPHVRRLFVRELTAGTHGNANGIGLADFTTTRLVRAMDRRATALNSLTALSLQGSKIPIHFDTDREVIGHALASLPLDDPRQAKVARIRDTLSLDRLQVSVACRDALEGQSSLQLDRNDFEMRFDADGNLPPMEE